MSITIVSAPPKNFDHTQQQTVTYKSSQYDGNNHSLTAIDPTNAQIPTLSNSCDLMPVGGLYTCTITIPANGVQDNALYVLVIWNSGGSASVTLDTRP